MLIATVPAEKLYYWMYAFKRLIPSSRCQERILDDEHISMDPRMCTSLLSVSVQVSDQFLAVDRNPYFEREQAKAYYT